MPDLTPLNGNNYLNAQNNGSIQLYAQYDIINYSITYNLDGGTNNSQNPTSYNINSNITFKDPTKTGYRFDGWYSNSAKTTRITGLNNTFGAKNIYAKFTPITYTIRFNTNGGSGGTVDVTHTYNQSQNLRANTFTRSGYNFLGWATSSTGGVIYSNAHSVVNLSSAQGALITLYAVWETQKYYAKITTYHISDWQTNSVSYNTIEVPFDSTFTFDTEKSFMYFGMNPNPPFNQIPMSQYGVFSAAYVGYSNGNAVPTNYYYKSGNQLTLYANYFASGADIEINVEYKNQCVAEGTLITLADGLQKTVETLTGNEQLLVWNLKTGQFDTAPILFIDSDPSAIYEVITLTFSDGTTVKVISEHAFWDIDLNKYVFLRNDAAQYIGHWFNKQITDANGNMTWMAVQLTNVVVANEVTTAWSPVTAEHLCYFVNGMLSMPGATTGLINIFEVNPETMQYDQEAMQADIEEYGLFTYEEFNEICPVPQEIFDAFDAQYFKVSIGKGLIDWETIGELVARYSAFFTVE